MYCPTVPPCSCDARTHARTLTHARMYTNTHTHPQLHRELLAAVASLLLLKKRNRAPSTSISTAAGSLPYANIQKLAGTSPSRLLDA